MKSFLSTIDRISEWAAKSIAYFIILAVGLVVSEVILRYAFDAPTIWGTELIIYLAATTYLIGGGYVLSLREHVRVDILYARLTSRMQAILDLVTSPLLFLFAGALLWAGVEWVWEDIIAWNTSGSAWNPPIFPAKMAIPLAGFFMVLQGLARLIRDFKKAFTGKDNEY